MAYAANAASTIAIVVGTALVAAGLVGAPGTDAIWIGAGAVIWVVTTAVLAPVVGKPVLLLCRSVFGGLFGEMIILPIHAAGGSTDFVRHGGRIPAPLSSLRN